MFEFRRLFQTTPLKPRDGLTGGDATLLELLDLDFLRAEAKASDVAAGRVSTKERPVDRPAMRVRQARIWRELARRTGDAVALRKAASSAELAANELEGTRSAATARLEQALCVMQGADLYGDDGLNAAADAVLAQAAAGSGLAAHAAAGKRARIAAGQALRRHDPMQALAELTAYDAVTNALRGQPKDRALQVALNNARIDRAEMMTACGEALKDDAVIARAATDLAAVTAGIDPAYEPLTWSRATRLRARALTRLGELTADTGAISLAVEELSRLFDVLLRDHSPLDWAAAQYAHGLALEALAEAAGSIDAFARAEGAFDRALHVLSDQPTLPLRATVAHARAASIARCAAATGDLMGLDEAEAAFRCQLAAADPHRDPAGWAVIQMNLGQIYQTRLSITGRDHGERARAALAFDAALDVFAELGMQGMVVHAEAGLKGLGATGT